MNALATQEEFDRLFAESAGPYLRVYLTLRLRGAVSIATALEEVYASLLATGALIYSGERKGSRHGSTLRPRGRDDGGRRFLSERGRPLDRTPCSGSCGRSRRGSGFRAHPHAFRRSVSTGLVRNGARAVAVKGLLGHKRLSTT